MPVRHTSKNTAGKLLPAVSSDKNTAWAVSLFIEFCHVIVNLAAADDNHMH